MSNVLDYEKQQQILALGRLGWTVSRIADATDVPAAKPPRGTCAQRGCRCGPAAARAKRRQNRPFPGRCPPTRPPKPAISQPEVSTDSPPSRAPSASACEPHRERIEAALTLGRNAMAIWQDLVEDGFTARYASVRRFVRQRRGPRAPRGARRHHDGARGRSAGRLRRRPDGPASADGPVPTHTALRPDARLLPQSGAPACLALECADVGRAPRAGVPPAGRPRRASSSSTISKKACSRPTSTTRRSIRSIATCSRTMGSSASRVACAIRIAKVRSNQALATRSAHRCTGCASSAWSRRKPIWIAGRRTGPDTRIHGTTKRQVAAMFAEERAGARAAARRAVSVLPLRGAHHPSRRLRGSRGRVLLGAARLDRPAHPGAMDGPARPSAGAVDGSAPARACPRPARLASHRGRRPPRADATADARAARPRPARRRPSPHRLHPYPTITTA